LKFSLGFGLVSVFGEFSYIHHVKFGRWGWGWGGGGVSIRYENEFSLNLDNNNNALFSFNTGESTSQ
jgi:hypothetical protein